MSEYLLSFTSITQSLARLGQEGGQSGGVVEALQDNVEVTSVSKVGQATESSSLGRQNRGWGSDGQARQLNVDPLQSFLQVVYYS